MTNFARELEVATRAAREAAALVLTYRGRPLLVERKAGDEPVTEADRAASALIVERLQAAFPDDVVLSEEIPDDRSRLGRARVWMVDPIDGTRDFVMGDVGFAVMIGLSIDGRPAVGAVAQPLSRKLYGGIAGQGSWLEGPDGARRALRTSALATAPGIRLVASKSHRTSRIDAVRRALQIDDEVNIGSVGLKIGLVAEAARDLYVYPGMRTKIWDSCGPEAILIGAGGRVSDMHGAPLVYDRADLENRRGIVASNGALHDYVIETLAPLIA